MTFNLQCCPDLNLARMQNSKHLESCTIAKAILHQVFCALALLGLHQALPLQSMQPTSTNKAAMTRPANDDELQISIQQSLQDIAEQMDEPIDEETATQLYQEAVDLLSHLTYEPITLARVAATLLLYQLQKIEPEELEWFKVQITQATDAEEVEELIESMSREAL